ncbi:MAG: DUF4912 domain-containing protein [Acidobacteria bacterium]|nr:DUF4912 domain-containing protein [Acidobacteriota bacterium]
MRRKTGRVCRCSHRIGSISWSIRTTRFRRLQALRRQRWKLPVGREVGESETDREVIQQIEAAGSWWYNVESDASYRAEIGFFAPGRPFIRVMFSNTIETPRKSPSPRQAAESDWAIAANEFAEVLDVAGFTRDAFEVALAGDDFESAEQATDSTFYKLLRARRIVQRRRDPL